MQEYWINLYDFSMDPAPLPNQLPIKYGGTYCNKIECMNENINYGFCKQIPIYRLHVKMKEVNGFNRDYPFIFVNGLVSKFNVSLVDSLIKLI